MRYIKFILLFLLTKSLIGSDLEMFNTKSIGIGFIENKGQIVDQNQRPNSKVLYLAPVAGMNILLHKEGFSYDTHRKSYKTDIAYNENGEEQIEEKMILKTHRVDVHFEGINPNFKILYEEPLTAHLNYYGHFKTKEITHVKQYSKVIYKDIYPKIDLEFLIINGVFKYNFILYEGANIEDIIWEYRGAKATLSNLKIQLHLQDEILEERIPLSYIVENGEHKKADVHYRLIGHNRFGFSSNPNFIGYRVIDPMPDLLWGTYYGGNGKTEGVAIDSDKFNRIYTAGSTFATNNIATSGSFQQTINVLVTGFFGKFTKNGQLIYGTYYPIGAFFSLIIDRNNNVVVSGESHIDSMATAGSFQPQHLGGLTDFHIAKFDSLGNRLWATYYGTYISESGGAMALDSNNNIIIAFKPGTDTNYLATPGTWQKGGIQTYLNGYRSVIAKFDSYGNRLWGTYIRGNNSINVLTLATAANDVIYAGGYTWSTDSIGSPGTFKPAPSNQVINSCGFIMKFSSQGQRIWGTYYQSTNVYETTDQSKIRTIVSDKNGYIYFGGETLSTYNFTTSGAYQANNAGGTDLFLAKFHPNGNRIWGTYYGGVNDDNFFNLTIDHQENLYICGGSYSTGLATSGAYITYCPTTGRNIITKFSPVGQRIWTTYLEAGVRDIEIDEFGKILVTGFVLATDSIATLGTYQSSHPLSGADRSSFICRFSDCQLSTAPIILSTSMSACPGQAASISFSGQLNQAAQWGLFANGQLINTTTGSSFTVFPIDTTTYYIKGIGGCVAKTDSTGVTINTKPIPKIFAGNDTTICTGSAILLSATGNANTYQWNIGIPNGSPFIVNSNTMLIATGIGANGCTNKDTMMVEVLPITQPTYINGFHEICIDDAPRPLYGGIPAGGYYTGPGVTGGIFYPDSVGIGTYNLTYTYTNSYGCSATDTDTLKVDPCTGIWSHSKNNASLKVYPNPAQDFVTFELCNQNTEELKLLIFNSIGEKIFEKELLFNTMYLDITNYPSGCYLFTIYLKNDLLFKGQITKN